MGMEMKSKKLNLLEFILMLRVVKMKKIILISLVFLCLNLISADYQETADLTSYTGNWLNSANTDDGGWTTYGVASSGVSVFFFNFSKVDNETLGSAVKVKDYRTASKGMNIAVPSSYEHTMTVYIERDFAKLNDETQEIQTSEDSDEESNLGDETVEEVDLSLTPVQYDDIDNSGDISIGDVVYLDPSLTSITIPDVTTGDVNNITAETNFTHLSIDNTQAPYDALVLYMPFDGDLENTATTTHYDYSSNNNDGTGVGDAFVNETGCLGGFGDCAHFDGVGDYIEMADNTVANLTYNFSYGAWVKFESGQSNTYPRIIAKGNNGQYEVFSNNLANFECKVEDSGTGNDMSSVSNTDPDTGVWYFVMCVLNSTDIAVYVNGVYDERGNKNHTITGNLDTSSVSLRIGEWGNLGAPRALNGSIDEVMIFNTSLTTAQVLAIYNNQSVRFKNPGLQGFNDQSILNISTGYDQVQVTGDYEANLGSSINLSVGYYNGSWSYTAEQVFSGGNTFTINDQSTNLTLNFTFYAGDGGSNDYAFYSPILMSNVNALQVNVSDTTAPTLTVDYPANNSRFNASSIDFNVSSDDLSWCGVSISGAANETMTINSSSTGADYTNSSIADGSYTFVVTCNDTGNNYGTSDTYEFLIDTVYPNISYDATTESDEANLSRNNIFVNVSAADSNNISTFIDFDGSLVSWWRMDDVDGSGNPTDYIGGNDGTAIDNAAQTDAGKLGKGFEFDGAGDYVIADYVDFAKDSYTMSAWINTVESTQQSFFVNSVNNSHRIGMTLISSEIRCGFYNGTGYELKKSGGTISLGQWYHVVCGLNASGIFLFVDAVGQTGTNTPSTGGGSRIIIGDQTTGSVIPFNGTIDDVMIFNRSLSADEISALYANSSTKYLERNFTGLDDGTHTFKAYTQDLGGNVNSTAERTVRTEVGSDVTYCRTLDLANTVYTLQNDITTTGDCLTILADNITIDGAGYSITGDGDSGDDGIQSPANTGLTNITIKNFNAISNFTRGIYLAQVNSSLIYNNTISMENDAYIIGIQTGGYGEGSGTLNRIENNTINLNTTGGYDIRGIYIWNDENFGQTTVNITGNRITINSTDDTEGIYQATYSGAISVSSLIKDNVIDIYANDDAEGISIENKDVTLLTIENNTISVNAGGDQIRGIYFEEDAGPINKTTVYNNRITVVSTDSTSTPVASGIYFDGGSYNNITLNTINSSNSNGGSADIQIHKAYSPNGFNHNEFYDNILQGQNWSVYVDDSGGTNSTLVNVSYSGGEYVGTGGELTRKWYYRAYVNDTLGNAVSGANVTAFNKTGDYSFNLTTDETGYTQIGEIIDYVNNAGTRTYYSDYNIYTEKTCYPSYKEDYNATLNENNLKNFLTLGSAYKNTVLNCSCIIDYPLHVGDYALSFYGSSPLNIQNNIFFNDYLFINSSCDIFMKEGIGFYKDS
jgi:hypothetical protein